MLTDSLKELLTANNRKRILLYGLEGLGKSYAIKSVSKQIPGGFFIITDFRKDDISGLIGELKSGKDMTEALVTVYKIPEEILGSVKFVLDEFLDPELPDEVRELITAPRGDYKYKEITIIFITSETAWAEKHVDCFDSTIKAEKISFKEYLDISENTWYGQIVEAHMTEKKTMPMLIHNELTDLYYDYISTGGYPDAVYESIRTDITPDLSGIAAKRFNQMIGRISAISKDRTEFINKTEIINTIPLCNLKGRFILSRTGRRHQGRNHIEESIKELTDEGMVLRIPRYDNNGCTLALTDDAVYRYLLNKKRYLYNLSDEKINNLVIENHLRNLLNDWGITQNTWSGTLRLKIGILLKAEEKLIPIRANCIRSMRSPSFEELTERFGPENIGCRIIITENILNESPDIIFLPIYGCEYLKTIIPQL